MTAATPATAAIETAHAPADPDPHATPTHRRDSLARRGMAEHCGKKGEGMDLVTGQFEGTCD